VVLFGGASPEAPVRWVRARTRDGGVEARGIVNAGESLPFDAAGDVVLVLRGAEAQLRSFEIKAHTEAQARGAAAFLFDGGLAREADATAYAVAPEDSRTGKRLAAAIDRNRLRDWIRRCEALRARPTAVYLDCALLDPPSGTVRLLEQGDSVIVSAGRVGGFSIEALLAPAIVRAWLKEQKTGVSEVRLEGPALGDLASIAREAGLGVTHDTGGDADAILARAAIHPPAWTPNLRQGEFASREKAQAGPRVWGVIVVLAFLAVSVQTLSMTLQGIKDEASAKALEARAEDRFRKVRPESGKVVNLRAQVSAALNTARPPAVNPVIATGRPTVDFLRTHPDVRLDEVRYEGPGRKVAMRFSGATPAQLEAALVDLRVRQPSAIPGQMQTVDGRVSLTVEMEAPQ
jgi:type II secretion system protein L